MTDEERKRKLRELYDILYSLENSSMSLVKASDNANENMAFSYFRGKADALTFVNALLKPLTM